MLDGPSAPSDRLGRCPPRTWKRCMCGCSRGASRTTSPCFKLRRPPAGTPLLKEPKGSPGPSAARPELAPGCVLRIPTKWCLAARGGDGYHFRYANQNPRGTDCARHMGLQSGEACGKIRVGPCSRTCSLIRGAEDLWRAARNPKVATHPRCVPSRKGLSWLDHRRLDSWLQNRDRPSLALPCHAQPRPFAAAPHPSPLRTMLLRFQDIQHGHPDPVAGQRNYPTY